MLEVGVRVPDIAYQLFVLGPMIRRITEKDGEFGMDFNELFSALGSFLYSYYNIKISKHNYEKSIVICEKPGYR